MSYARLADQEAERFVSLVDRRFEGSSPSTGVHGSALRIRRLNSGSEGMYLARIMAPTAHRDEHPGELHQGIADLAILVILGRPDEAMTRHHDAAEHEQDPGQAEDRQSRARRTARWPGRPARSGRG